MGDQNFSFESMGRWGGGHKPPLISLIFFIFHAPLFTTTTEKWREDMKRYAYDEMPSVRFFCGNAHRHLIMRKYRQMHIHIWEVF